MRSGEVIQIYCVIYSSSNARKKKIAIRNQMVSYLYSFKAKLEERNGWVQEMERIVIKGKGRQVVKR